MIVAELTAPREFHFAESDIPEPGPGEALVRVGAVGICGSDLHEYSEGVLGDSVNVYPMVLGHEPAGTVVKTGPGVTGWSPGDRAALEPALYCYHCEFCLSGRHNLCAQLRFMGSAGQAPGFFREFVTLPARNLLGIPANMALETATLVEPLAVALHSMQFAALAIGDTVAVFGAGPIGLLTIACVRAAGAGRIWVVEPLWHRRELALHMGADAVLDPNAMDVIRQLLVDTGQRGVDCSIDCAAHGESTNWAINATRNGGRLVLTGIHSDARVPFETSPMRRKELSLVCVRRSNHEPAAALRMLIGNPKLFAPLVTHTRPLEKVGEAFRIAANYTDGVGKMIVK